MLDQGATAFRVVVKHNRKRLVIAYHLSRESAQITSRLLNDPTTKIEAVRNGATAWWQRIKQVN
jgi:hypothetical protein